MTSRKVMAKILILTILVLYAGILTAIPAFAESQVLTVGPGKMFATPNAALTAAQPGDTIEVYADGSYYGADYYMAITKSDITVRGVAADGIARPHIIADPARRLTWGKAIWLVVASNVTIENIEFSGATLPFERTDPVTGQVFGGSKNGRGIGIDNGANVTVRNCSIHDCDDGVLTNNTTAITNLTFEGCDFGDNGFGDGYSHNLYIGKIGTLYFKNNYSHNCDLGHLLKTRAKVNYIEYNRLTEEGPGRLGLYANSNIDFSNAGYSYVVGNLFQQPDVNDSGNKRMISYGVEGPGNPGWTLNLVNNTFVNDETDMGGNYFVQLHNATTAYIKNNIFTGSGEVVGNYNGGLTSQLVDSSNLVNFDPGYADRSNYDYRLTASSVEAIDKGTDPGTSAEGNSLVPVLQYVHNGRTEARPVYGSLDIGAYEYGIAAEIDFDPDVIKVNEISSGDMATVYVAFPAGTDVSGFDLSNIKLNGTLSPVTDESLGYVKNVQAVAGADGMQVFMIKFRKDEVAACATDGTIVISGNLGTTPFGGKTTVIIK